MTNEEKVRENKLRRMAQRQGLQLSKSARRDVRAYDYNKYALLKYGTKKVVFGKGELGYDATIDDIEDWLTGKI